MKDKKKLCIVAAICIAVGAVVFPRLYINYHSHRFEQLLEDIAVYTESEMPSKIQTDEYVTVTSCVYSPTFSEDKFGDMYWHECYSITLESTNEFDTWPEDWQYYNLCRIADQCEEQVFEVLDVFPHYRKYSESDGILDKIFKTDTFNTYRLEIKVITPDNRYEYAEGYEGDYSFQKNGYVAFATDREYHNPIPSNISGECMLSHCDWKAEPGKKYCSRHGCCRADCDNQKDPLSHCCDKHKCKESGCSAHRYDAVNSLYCRFHYDRRRQG